MSNPHIPNALVAKLAYDEFVRSINHNGEALLEVCAPHDETVTAVRMARMMIVAELRARAERAALKQGRLTETGQHNGALAYALYSDGLYEFAQELEQAALAEEL